MPVAVPFKRMGAIFETNDGSAASSNVKAVKNKNIGEIN